MNKTVRTILQVVEISDVASGTTKHKSVPDPVCTFLAL